jgi:putative peptidoglycan lipid II flippase
LLAEPIVAVLFQRGAFGPSDSAAVAGAVAAIAIGIPGHAIEKVFASVCFAREDTRTPMLTALAGLATTAVGAVLAFHALDHVGVALAVAGCGWVSAALLGVILARRKWLHTEAEFWRRLAGIIAATVVMGAAVVGMRAFLTHYAGPSETWLRAFTILTILIVSGVAAYVAVLRLLGIMRIEEFAGKDRSEG